MLLSLEIGKEFHSTLYNGYDSLSKLRLNFIYPSKEADFHQYCLRPASGTEYVGQMGRFSLPTYGWFCLGTHVLTTPTWLDWTQKDIDGLIQKGRNAITGVL